MSEELRIVEFKALDISQEHWAMAVTPCECGTAWTNGAQSLTIGPNGPVDEWEVECRACGTRAIFRFDVSGFFGHQDRMERWVEERLPSVDQGVRDRIVRKIGPPFGARFRSVVQGLAKDGEIATLLFLRAEVDRALAEAQGARSVSPTSR